ncbi:MAG: hypothetical protein KDA84_06835 [Planctomycetaceae bacterium]|nr:hypothetical protein [Planctomycetaceae bacterium]
MKNRNQSALPSLLAVVPVKTLFNQAGQQWLTESDLSTSENALIASDLRMIEAVAQEMVLLEKTLQKEAWKSARVRLMLTIPNVEFYAALTLIAALKVCRCTLLAVRLRSN